MQTAPTLSWRFDTRPLHDPIWWQWLAMLVLLVGHVTTGGSEILYAALLLAGATTLGGLLSSGWRSHSSQARILFLVLLTLACVPDCGWVSWPLVMTLGASLGFGYCPLLRFLMLLPWNRTTPLTRRQIAAAFRAPPGAGGVFRLCATADNPFACSL